MANILGSIITAGIAIMAIALLAMTTGRTLVALPAFNTTDPQEAPWAETLTTVSDNAGTAFNLLGIAPLVLVRPRSSASSSEHSSSPRTEVDTLTSPVRSEWRRIGGPRLMNLMRPTLFGILALAALPASI